MNISDRRVVMFREWAERRFQIGSGPYGDAADLLSVVMDAVDARARAWQQGWYEAMRPDLTPAFEAWLKQAVK